MHCGDAMSTMSIPWVHQHCVNRLHHQIPWAYWYHLMLLWWGLLSYKAKDWPFLKFEPISHCVTLWNCSIFYPYWHILSVSVRCVCTLNQWWTKQNFVAKDERWTKQSCFHHHWIPMMIHISWMHGGWSCSMCTTQQTRWGLPAPSAKMKLKWDGQVVGWLR